jgi:predicted small metal-binding protein
MERLYADCGELPSEGHCAAVIFADSEMDLLEAAARHAKEVHGHKDGPELRNALRQTFHLGSPPTTHLAATQALASTASVDGAPGRS